MRSKLCAGSIALLLVVIALLFIFPGMPVFAGSTGSLHLVLAAPIVTPTPDTTAALNAANNAVSQAQNLLTVISIFATILGVVLGLFSVFAIVIGILGFRSYGEFRTLVKDLRTNMAETREDADNTRSALVYLSLGDRFSNSEGYRRGYQKL